MNDEKLAETLIDLKIGYRKEVSAVRCGKRVPQTFYVPPGAGIAGCNVDQFVRHWLVAGTAMQMCYERKFSILIMQLPGERPIVTVQHPIRSKAEHNDPEQRDTWAGQAVGDDSLARAVNDACTQALTAE